MSVFFCGRQSCRDGRGPKFVIGEFFMSKLTKVNSIWDLSLGFCFIFSVVFGLSAISFRLLMHNFNGFLEDEFLYTLPVYCVLFSLISLMLFLQIFLKRVCDQKEKKVILFWDLFFESLKKKNLI